jgi:hypothetical protein
MNCDICVRSLFLIPAIEQGGHAFEYFRNNVLNANSWTRNQTEATNDVAPFRYNQYGYNIGGPAYIPKFFNRDKNKFFFFWGQEWLKYHYGENADS